MSLRAGQRESGYLAASASVSRIVRGRSRCHGSAELAKIRSVSEWKSATALAALAALAISILAVVFSFLLAVFLFPPTLFLSLSLSLSLLFLRIPHVRTHVQATTCTCRMPPVYPTRGIATEMNRYGARGDGIVCHSSLSSPISRQFHVVHKLSPSRARARTA